MAGSGSSTPRWVAGSRLVLLPIRPTLSRASGGLAMPQHILMSGEWETVVVAAAGASGNISSWVSTVKSYKKKKGRRPLPALFCFILAAEVCRFERRKQTCQSQCDTCQSLHNLDLFCLFRRKLPGKQTNQNRPIFRKIIYCSWYSWSLQFHQPTKRRFDCKAQYSFPESGAPFSPILLHGPAEQNLHSLLMLNVYSHSMVCFPFSILFCALNSPISLSFYPLGCCWPKTMSWRVTAHPDLSSWCW